MRNYFLLSLRRLQAKKFEPVMGLHTYRLIELINWLSFAAAKTTLMDPHKIHFGHEELLREIRKIVLVGVPRAFYPPNEAQAILGMSRSKLHYLVKQGRFEVRHVDKKIFYTHRSIVRLVMGSDYSDAYTN